MKAKRSSRTKRTHKYAKGSIVAAIIAWLLFCFFKDPDDFQPMPYITAYTKGKHQRIIAAPVEKMFSFSLSCAKRSARLPSCASWTKMEETRLEAHRYERRSTCPKKLDRENHVNPRALRSGSGTSVVVFKVNFQAFYVDLEASLVLFYAAHNLPDARRAKQQQQKKGCFWSTVQRCCVAAEGRASVLLPSSVVLSPILKRNALKPRRRRQQQVKVLCVPSTDFCCCWCGVRRHGISSRYILVFLSISKTFFPHFHTIPCKLGLWTIWSEIMCGTWARFSKVLEFGYLFTFSCLGYRVPISVISLKPVILCVPSARHTTCSLLSGKVAVVV